MNHPITPPLQLVQQWINEEDGLTAGHIATQAARWGADQELEACITWLRANGYPGTAFELNDLRRPRPKPPSLKEQAITALHAIAAGANDTREQHQDLETIRRALEALPND
jgi:hypothetical protein